MVSPGAERDGSTAPAVADRLVELLRAAGVDVVFGIGGTHSLPFFGALERSGSIRLVAARNEQGAAYMAAGYARASGRPGVVVTSTGPGALNALSGLADAKWSSLPIVHITTYADDGPNFSGGIHESPEQPSVMRLIGKSFDRVSGSDVDEPFWRAWASSRTSPAGPATLEVRFGAWLQAADVGPVRDADVDIRAVAGDLTSVSKALSVASTPVIFAGGGVRRAGVQTELIALAEQLDAPVITSIQGRGAIPDDHPLALGPWSSEEAVRSLVAQSDVCLVLGSKLSALSTTHWTLPLPTSTFRLDSGAHGHGRYERIVDIDIDLRVGVAALVDNLPRSHHGAAEKVAIVRDAVDVAARERAPLEMDYVDVANSIAASGAAVSFDMNKASFWLTKYGRCGLGDIQAFSSYLCMGSALPFAIGMANAGARRAVAFVGDGGLQMSMSELATLAESRADVTVVVLVDGKYGLLRDTGAQPAVRGSHEYGITLWNPDFEQLSKVFELQHARCKSPHDLAQAVKELSRPALIEVHADFARDW